MTQTDLALLPSSETKYSILGSSYGTREDNCDESSEGDDSCDQLLLNSFPSTTVPNTVASFSLSSSSSGSQENMVHQRRGRLKQSILRRQTNKCHTRQRKHCLGSWWNRYFFSYRRNCRPVGMDAVLAFMLFLAMLHLSW